MSRLVISIILGSALVALAWYAVDAHNEQVNELRLALGKDELRLQFEERASGIHGQSNTERRVEELTQTTKWYTSELASLCNQFPGKCDPDRAIKEAEAATAAGAAKPGDLELRKEFASESKGLFESIRGGKYKPIATADVEGVRIDLLSMKRAQDEGKSRIRLEVAIWGAPQQLVNRGDANATRNAPVVMKKQLNFNLRGLSFEFINEDDKLLGGLDTGSPRFLIEAPERWYEDFPPQGAFAVWWIDPLPADADHLTMKLSGEVKSPTNGSLGLNTSWEMKVDPDWRVKPGEKFDGEQRLMPEEELDRSAGGGAGAAGKKHAQK